MNRRRWRRPIAPLLALALGACGHGDGGTTEPTTTVLASGIQFLPAATSSAVQYRATVAVVGDQVYFSDSSSAPLKTVSTRGGAVSVVNSDVGQALPRFVLSGSSLVVADGLVIKRVPLSGGSSTVLGSAGSDPFALVGDLVVDSSDILVGIHGYAGMPNVVRNLPLDGGMPTDYVGRTPGGGRGCLVRVARDATNVYWLASGMTDVDQCAIYRAPIAGGTATVLAESAIEDFAIAGNDVFFAEELPNYSGERFGNGALYRVASQGGPTTTVSFGGSTTAMVGSTTIIALQGGGKVLVPASGVAITLLGSGREYPQTFNDLAVAGGAAYRTEVATGTVSRISPVP